MANFRGILILAACLLAACSSDNQPAKVADAANDPAPAADNSAAAREPVSVDNIVATANSDVRPSHYYATEDDGEYGYTQELSENDKRSGMASAPLVMIRYLGEQGGIYRIAVPGDGGVQNIISCANPCEFMKSTVVWNGQVIKHITVPAGTTIAAAAFQDAANGQLKPYGAH